MTYVDLNPVRTGIADSPEASPHTSIQERIQPAFDLQRAVKGQQQCGDLMEFGISLKPLASFEESLLNHYQTGILFSFHDYVSLVDWTGRVIRGDKRGHVDPCLPPIMDRLQIFADQWNQNTTQFEVIHSRRFNRPTLKADTG
jgi:hypothetical protein